MNIVDLQSSDTENNFYTSPGTLESEINGKINGEPNSKSYIISNLISK